MTFYISCRPLRYRREIISPKECLKYNFPGIKYEFRCIGFNHKLDGRWLYEIKLDDSYSAEDQIELQGVFIEGLSAFGAHLKTKESATELANKLEAIL